MDKEGPQFFKDAADLLSTHLRGIFDEARRQCLMIANSVVEEIGAQLSVLWENNSERDVERQKELAARLSPTISHLIHSVLQLQPQAEYFAAPVAEPQLEIGSAPPIPDLKRGREDEHDMGRDGGQSPQKKVQEEPEY